MPERAVILLAEDEEDCVFLVRKDFCRSQNPLHVVSNGKK
jgi:hypothetical protein